MGCYSTSDFLESDPYTKEYRVSNIDSKWPIIALLGEKQGNSIEGKTKLAKELFLEMALEQIPMPLNFTKFPNGPYTKQITHDAEKLEAQGDIEKNKKYRYKETDCIEFKLTTSGRKKYEEQIKPKLPKFAITSLHRANQTSSYSGTDLADFCYDNFRLKKKSMKHKQWKNVRNRWVESIKERQENLLNSNFKAHVADDLRYNLMMPISYSQNLFNEGRLRSYDESFQVESGVVLMSMEKIISNVNDVMRIINAKKVENEDMGEVKSNLERLDRSFYFLNTYSEKYGIYSSMYSDHNPIEFMNESDKQRVEKRMNS